MNCSRHPEWLLRLRALIGDRAGMRLVDRLSDGGRDAVHATYPRTDMGKVITQHLNRPPDTTPCPGSQDYHRRPEILPRAGAVRRRRQERLVRARGARPQHQRGRPRDRADPVRLPSVMVTCGFALLFTSFVMFGAATYAVRAPWADHVAVTAFCNGLIGVVLVLIGAVLDEST